MAFLSVDRVELLGPTEPDDGILPQAGRPAKRSLPNQNSVNQNYLDAYCAGKNGGWSEPIRRFLRRCGVRLPNWNKAMLSPAIAEGEITKVLSEFLATGAFPFWE